jgi:hypothetical protein
MAGEFLTAGQLLKRGLLVCVTMGNAKAIDLLVHNDRTQKDFHVQVKTMRKKCAGWFMKRPDREHIYVFVLLNGPSEQERYFIVSGRTLEGDPHGFFGPKFDPEKPSSFDGVDWKSVQEFRDNWQVFDEQ